MNLFTVGLNHRTVPLPIREKFTVSDSRIPELLQTLLTRGYLEEGIILSTCNRFEVYGVTSLFEHSLVGLERFLSEQKGFSLEELEKCWYAHEGKEAVKHLFKVASGLDSMLFGETEIQRQVRDAYEKTRNHGFTGSVLNRLFEKALNAAKAVREKTGLANVKTSVGAYAVEVARKIFGETLAAKRLLVLGAGEIGEKVACHFASSGILSIAVASRSYERAAHLSNAVGGTALSLDQLPDVLPNCDVVISSTKCPKILLRREVVGEALTRRQGNPIFFIDLSVPRNIDPGIHQLPNAYLYHLDDLEQMVAQGIEVKKSDLMQCEEIIEGKALHFMKWLETLPEESVRQNSPALYTLPAS